VEAFAQAAPRPRGRRGRAVVGQAFQPVRCCLTSFRPNVNGLTADRLESLSYAETATSLYRNHVAGSQPTLQLRRPTVKQLKEKCGLSIKFDPCTMQVSFGKEVADPLCGTRELDALRPLMLDPTADGPEVLYWMYRYLFAKGDRDVVLGKHRLRYDMSCFKPGMLGREYMKTSGHYHPLVFGGGPAYPEVYEIAYGEALFLLQKVSNHEAGPDDVVVEDVIAMRATAGDKAIMPPGYGHVTIITTDEPLVMTNWVSDDFSSFYGSTEKCKGFAYYALKGAGGVEWAVNETYARKLPPLRHAVPCDVPELGLTKGKPMYETCRKNPELFAFLNRPWDFEELMRRGIKITG
jgi:glucose-6-phosphate isomerase, archaeal